MWALVALISCFAAAVTAFPQSHVVVASEPAFEPSEEHILVKRETTVKPQVNSLRIDSVIKNRYAKTRVMSRLANPSNVSQEVFFSMLLPQTAFITSFIMEIDGKQYEAYVKEKEEAKNIYTQAVQSGIAAAHVEVNARDSNNFRISVNVEGEGKVLFILSYEEMLIRSLGVYSHYVNINPGQIVKDLQVNVYISEQVPIADVRVPALRTSNELDSENEKNNTIAKITRTGDNRVHVQYAPSTAEQETSFGEKLGGQLVVQYDVDRTKGSQIFLNDGYFVHFFSPQGLDPLRKMAVFVLDVSGSMDGRKMSQLKQAMMTILDDLGPNDYFNLIDFSYAVTVHDLDSQTESAVLPPDYTSQQQWWGPKEITGSTKVELPKAYPTSKEYIDKAKQVIERMSAGGGTNIYDALKNAIIVAQSGIKKIRKQENTTEAAGKGPIEPIIVFLTDGDPTVGITRTSQILTMVKEFNFPKSAIFSLGFGEYADQRFLRKLSLANSGFSRSIYEAADAHLQLKNFYKEIASPLLSNVTFHYLPGQVHGDSLTKDFFPTLFRGSEIVIAGKVTDQEKLFVNVSAIFTKGETNFDTTVSKDVLDDTADIDFIPNDNSTDVDILRKISKKHAKDNTLERLWAYLTINQMIDEYDNYEGDKNKTDEIKKNATALALKYKFVTQFTSLVVVKPNKTDAAAIDPAKTTPGADPLFSLGQSSTSLIVGGIPYMRFSAAGRPAPMAPAAASFGVYQSSLSSEAMGAGGPGYLTTPLDRVDGGVSPYLTIDDLLWFKNIYTERHHSLALPLGDNNSTVFYAVAQPAPNTTFQECQVEGESTPFKCKHLGACVVPEITQSLDQYLPYFCEVPGKFAGVCCPSFESMTTDPVEPTTIPTTTMNP